MCTTHFWDNIHQVQRKLKDWEKIILSIWEDVDIESKQEKRKSANFTYVRVIDLSSNKLLYLKPVNLKHNYIF